MFKKVTCIVLGFFLGGILVVRLLAFYQNQPQFVEGQEVHLVTTLSEEPEFSNKG